MSKMATKASWASDPGDAGRSAHTRTTSNKALNGQVRTQSQLARRVYFDRERQKNVPAIQKQKLEEQTP
jgi:hypothetical protein